MEFSLANDKLIKCQDGRVTAVAWARCESCYSGYCEVNDVIMSRVQSCRSVRHVEVSLPNIINLKKILECGEMFEFVVPECSKL